MDNNAFGWTPNQARTWTDRPSKRDHGHSVVKRLTIRPGDAARLRYTLWCECGKKFGGQVGPTTLRKRHEVHVKTALTAISTAA